MISRQRSAHFAMLPVALALLLGADGALLAQDGGLITRSSNVQPKNGNGVLAQTLNMTIRGDVVSAGVGLRGTGAGDIVVTGIPSGGVVARALLYWATLGANGVFTSPTLNATPVNGARIGTGADTCWGATNNFVYRADVTPIVTGNGTYHISGLPNLPATGNDSQGASLVVIFRHASHPSRAIVINDGAVVLNLVNGPLSHTDSISGFTPTSSTGARLTLVVGDGQDIFLSGDLFFNGSLIGTDVFTGTDGDFWDTLTFNVSALSPSSPSTVSMIGDQDCLLWAATVFSIQGRAAEIFSDGFESGDTDAWTFSTH